MLARVVQSSDPSLSLGIPGLLDLCNYPGMAKHLEFGRACEDSALKYFLEEFPAQLVARNYRCKMGELDLIFEVNSEVNGEQSCELVVVEVRGRVRNAMVNAIESVGPKKLLKIQNTIRHFVMSYEGPARSVRLDLMAWNEKSLSHIRDIWLF